MIPLFNIPTHVVDTSLYRNALHDEIVTTFEKKITSYVGAKYGVSLSSATNAIFLCLLNKKQTIKVPSMIPPVVLNAIITSNNRYEFVDNVSWVGDSYVLHDFGDYKIVDSAQKLEKNQFSNECNDSDLMIFSFYPTKPVGSFDGGIIVSNDLNKIEYLRSLSMNGMSFAENNWDRKIKSPGYKMYMNSIQCDIALRNFESYENKIKKLLEIKKIYNNSLGYKNTSNHLYRINVDGRPHFIDYMYKNNVVCGIHYESLSTNSVYKIPNSNCPNSESESLKTVSIPFHENLTNQEISHIIKLIKNYNVKQYKST